MSAFTGPAVLAANLRQLADHAEQASRYAAGSYLMHGDRELELHAAATVADHVLAHLRALMPVIQVDGGDHDGIAIAHRAVHDVVDARDALNDQSSPDYVELAAGTANSLLRSAAAGLRTIAEIAEFRALTHEEFHRGITHAFALS